MNLLGVKVDWIGTGNLKETEKCIYASLSKTHFWYTLDFIGGFTL